MDIKKYKSYITNIKGKEYVTVAGRILMFWDKVAELKATDASLTTDVQYEGSTIRVTAHAKIGNWSVSGHASEVVGKGLINSTNALENAETSAIGRALGNLGLGLIGAGGGASAEEVGNAINKQAKLKTPVKGVANEQTTALTDKCQGHFEEGEDVAITKAEADYSRKLYGMPLCREHQKLAKQNGQPTDIQ